MKRRELTFLITALILAPLSLWGIWALPSVAFAAVVGLIFLLADRRSRAFRPLGWAVPAILALLVVAGSKPYYAGAAYSLLFAAGAVAVEAWSARLVRGAAWGLRGALAALVVVVGLALAPIARPVLPVESFVAYAQTLGITPSSGERHEQGRLPQFFADRFGWPEMVATVARVHRSLPPDERRRCGIVASNYGEAGAINLFGPRYELPPAICAHQTHSMWGPGDFDGDQLIWLQWSAESLERICASVEIVGEHHPAVTEFAAKDIPQPLVGVAGAEVLGAPVIGDAIQRAAQSEGSSRPISRWSRPVRPRSTSRPSPRSSSRTIATSCGSPGSRLGVTTTPSTPLV